MFIFSMFKQYNISLAGNTISEHKSHVDFETEHNYSEEECKDIETKINNLIKKNLDVNHSKLNFEDAILKLSPERVRIDRLPHLETIRVVEIEDVDATACGGTHVSNTSEIGIFKILKFKSKGRNRKRFYFAVEN